MDRRTDLACIIMMMMMMMMTMMMIIIIYIKRYHLHYSRKYVSRDN